MTINFRQRSLNAGLQLVHTEVLKTEYDKNLKEIFIIDDEKEICRSLKGILKDEGYKVDFSLSPEEALSEIKQNVPDLILLDVWFGKRSWDGLHILEQLKQLYPMLPVIMISGHGTFELAVRAIKKGAYDFIEKPFEIERLLLSIQRALENSQLKIENAVYKTGFRLETEPWPFPIDPAMRKLAHGESRILLMGEKGSGKKSLAYEIHKLSSRKDCPVLLLNSHEINTFEDQDLWGLEKDGKIETLGILEKAQGGTVVLTNVHALKKSLQVQFARLFESQVFTRVNGQKNCPLNVRFLFTADINQPLKEVLHREFYDRISLSTFETTPLSKKPHYIRTWIQLFVKKIGLEMGRPDQTISPEALKMLQGFDWPGNIRQLRNVLESILLNTTSGVIEKEDLPSEISGIMSSFSHQDIFSLPLQKARMLFEYEYLSVQLAAVNGNVSHAAQIIGMERSALHRKIKLLKNKTQKKESLLNIQQDAL